MKSHDAIISAHMKALGQKGAAIRKVKLGSDRIRQIALKASKAAKKARAGKKRAA